MGAYAKDAFNGEMSGIIWALFWIFVGCHFLGGSEVVTFSDNKMCVDGCNGDCEFSGRSLNMVCLKWMALKRSCLVSLIQGNI